MSKRHPVQYSELLWELLQKAAAKESAKRGRPITTAEYTRQVVRSTLNKERLGR